MAIFHLGINFKCVQAKNGSVLQILLHSVFGNFDQDKGITVIGTRNELILNAIRLILGCGETKLKKLKISSCH